MIRFSLDDCVRNIERGTAGYKIDPIIIAAGGRTGQMPESAPAKEKRCSPFLHAR